MRTNVHTKQNENSFESHNELRHGISGKFVNSATSWLHLCSFKVPVFIPRFKVVNVNKTTLLRDLVVYKLPSFFWQDPKSKS